MLWIALLNIAIVFYFRVFPDCSVSPCRRAALDLFVFNTAALAAWRLAAGHRLAERALGARLLAIASGGLITVLMLEAILGALESTASDRASRPSSLPGWLASAYAVYHDPARRFASGGCLSVIVVVTRSSEAALDAAAIRRPRSF